MFSALGSLFGSALMPAIHKALPKALSGISDIVTQDIPSMLGGKNIMDVASQRGKYLLGGIGEIGKDTLSNALSKAMDGTTDNPGNVALASQFSRMVDMNMNNRTVPNIQPAMVNEQGAGSINLATLGANKPPLEQEIVDSRIEDAREYQMSKKDIKTNAKWYKKLIGLYKGGQTYRKLQIDGVFKDPYNKEAVSLAFGKKDYMNDRVSRQELDDVLTGKKSLN